MLINGLESTSTNFWNNDGFDTAQHRLLYYFLIYYIP